jgi:GAF domain-containing protein
MTVISEFVDKAIQHARQMRREGILLPKILHHLASAGETISGKNSVASILLLDKDGLLRNGASPQLPADYLSAIDGIRPHPKLGTCAAAAATGSVIITTDFTADDKWAELRHLPLALGFAGAWSMPIKNSDGTVLGTFGTYFRDKRSPSSHEIESIRALADTTAEMLAPTG